MNTNYTERFVALHKIAASTFYKIICKIIFYLIIYECNMKVGLSFHIAQLHFYRTRV